MDPYSDLPTDVMVALFDQIKETTFFVKNTQGEFLTCNQELVSMLRLAKREDIIGKTDFELFPQHNAKRYRDDDLKVMASKKAMTHIVELVPNEIGQLHWYFTQKYPILNDREECIGITGICQKKQGDHLSNIYPESISKVLDHIAAHYSEKINIPHLAKMTFQSQRSLERKFKEIFNMTILNYVQQTRLQAVAHLLRNSKMTLTEISHCCGFCDQSYMTKEFKKRFGLPPKKFISQR